MRCRPDPSRALGKRLRRLVPGGSLPGLGYAFAPGLTTADGIGIGSTRVELEASREVEVEATTLGTEFSAGGLGGLFASPEPAAEIVSLWAGLTCHFR